MTTKEKEDSIEAPINRCTKAFRFDALIVEEEPIQKDPIPENGESASTHLNTTTQSKSVLTGIPLSPAFSNLKNAAHQINNSVHEQYSLVSKGIDTKNLGDPFVHVVMDGQIIECNDLYCEMLGYTSQEICTLRYQDLTPQRWHDFEEKIVREQIIPRGYSDIYQKEYRCKDGTIIPVELRTILLHDEARKPSGMWAIIRNITERKRKEEQIHHKVEMLAAANRELESFSYSVSHDLRSPLNTINCLNELLTVEYSDKLDKDGKNILNQTKCTIGKMASTIDDILRLTGISRETMNPQWIDLSLIVETIVHELHQTEPQRNVSIDIANTLPAFADARLMTIALTNLIGNAWKYTSKNPDAHIEIGSLFTDTEYGYFIRDNGAGFDMRSVHLLFKPFQRLHSESQFTGTGIGLAIVEKIIQRHGGTIQAEGEIGKGATFRFTLAAPLQSAFLQSATTLHHPF